MYIKPPQPKKRYSIQQSLLMITAVALVLFVGTKVYPFVHGPTLLLEELENGTTLHEPKITLSGIAKYTKNISINGVPIELSPDGAFSESIVLAPGYNIITTEAKDRFGSSSDSVYQLVLKENENKTFTLDTLSELDNSLRKN